MNTQELQKILENHKLWLQADKKEGERADLIGAHLYGADLIGAHLYGADLSRADLSRADLRGANLSHTKGVWGFYLGQHFGFAYKFENEVFVKIGCEYHKLSYWLENGREIGEKAGYSEKKMKLYGKLFDMIHWWAYSDKTGK